MRERLKQAASDGLVLGVKGAVALVVVALAVMLFLGDYSVVRQRALNGQKAFEFLATQQPQPPK